jgi:hypothetical protein
MRTAFPSRTSPCARSSWGERDQQWAGIGSSVARRRSGTQPAHQRTLPIARPTASSARCLVEIGTSGQYPGAVGSRHCFSVLPQKLQQASSRSVGNRWPRQIMCLSSALPASTSLIASSNAAAKSSCRRSGAFVPPADLFLAKREQRRHTLKRPARYRVPRSLSVELSHASGGRRDKNRRCPAGSVPTTSA